MSATAQPRRHLLRWIGLAVVAILLAAAIAFAIYIHNLLQPQRFTTLLENNLAAIGLHLEMQAPAEPNLFPRPGVQMRGFSLTNTGSNTPVLRASGATIVVPWRALLHGEVAIERVEVDAPRVDLDELRALLARLPRHSGPPTLPTITTGVQMRRGTLTRNRKPLLFDLSVETGALAPGQPFKLKVSGRSASGQRLSATMTTVPSASHDGVIDFQPLQLHIASLQGPALRLNGEAHWRGGANLALHLEGKFSHRALAPPASATSVASGSSVAATGDAALVSTDTVSIDVQPAQDHEPLLVALKLDGTDSHVDMRLRPTQLGDWWQHMFTAAPDSTPAELPFAGTARVQRLDLGQFKATGLSIEATSGQAPATAASAAPAAAASSAR